MNKVFSFKRTLFLCFLLPLFSIVSHATPPDLTNGGVPDHDYRYNLGPTGMRGYLYRPIRDSRQILVTTVETGSPADGILAVGDVILGADGTGAEPVEFTSDARKTLALAIGDAEANNPAVLKLLRWRDDIVTTVEVPLQYLGAYSATAPYNCAKSAAILENGLDYIMANEDAGKFSMAALALLAANDPSNPKNAARQSQAQTYATSLIVDQARIDFWKSGDIDRESKISWKLGHELTVLTEYYLQTNDASVLPTIEAMAIQIANGTSLFGTMGHQLTGKAADGSLNGPYRVGYGVINSTVVPCFMGLRLAKECGISVAEVDAAIDRMSKYVGYHAGWGSMSYGEHEPTTQKHAGNGKSGAAALAFALDSTRDFERTYFAKLSVASAKERESGHTGPFFNFLWTPLGANVGGEEAAAAHFSEISWLLDFNRRWDWGFDYDVNDSSNSLQWKDQFWMSTPALLTYAMPLRQLHITGRNQDPADWLSSAEVADALFSASFDASGRSSNDLLSDLNSWSSNVQQKAANELASRTAEHATLLPTLHSMATDPDGGRSRAGACMALGGIADDSSASVLAGLLTDADVRVRLESAKAMQQLSRSANLTVLDTILSAVATTAKPALPIDPEDPLHHAHGQLSRLLFNSDGTFGPQGVIAGNQLDGVDRNLLYPAIRAVAEHPQALTRNSLVQTYPSLAPEDFEPMVGTVLKSAMSVVLADRMFAGADRKAAIQYLQANDVMDGVPASIYLFNDSVERTGAVNNLGSYGASVDDVTPSADVEFFLKKLLTGGYQAAAQAALDAIAADSDPESLTSLKRFDSVSADDSQLTLPADQTQLHATVTNLGEVDTVYTWRKLHGAGNVTFSINGTTASSTTTVQFDGTPGKYTFEVVASDEYELTEVSETVAVTLYDTDGTLPANDPPVANAQTVSVAPAVRAAITLGGSDPEGLPLVYFVATSPKHGVLSGTAPNLIYTANYTYTLGSDSFDFIVMDSEGNTDTATVTINVDPDAGIEQYVHEPFDYPVGLLAGNTGGTGFVGAWADGPEPGTASIYDETTAVTPVDTGYGTLSWDGVLDNMPRTQTGTANFVGGTANDGDKWESYRTLAQDAGTMAGADGVLWVSMLWHKEGWSWGQHGALALATDCFKSKSRALDTSGSYGSGAGDGLGLAWSGTNTKDYSVAVFNGGSQVDLAIRSGQLNKDYLLVLKFEFGATDKVSAFAFEETTIVDEAVFEAYAVTATGVVDESTLNILTFSNVRGDHAYDDIRVGNTLASVAAFAENNYDVTSPTPDPMTFDVAPVAQGYSSITMTATTASDPSGVEYYFTCTAGGAPDSGWQDSPIYTVDGLTPETEFTFTVVARDKSVNKNMTAPSSPLSATTESQSDLYVHEPFDYPVGPLAGASGGVGLSGAWADGPESGTASVYDETTAVTPVDTGYGTLSWDGVLNNLPDTQTGTANFVGGTANDGDKWESYRPLALDAGTLAGADGVLWASMLWHKGSYSFGQHGALALTTDSFKSRSTALDTSGSYGSGAGDGLGLAWKGSNSTDYSVAVFNGGSQVDIAHQPGQGDRDYVVVLKFEFGATDKVSVYAFEESETLDEAVFEANAVSASGVVDESTLNILTFSNARGDHAYDDIRIGKTFATVVGGDSTGGNNAPVADDQSVSTDEDTSVAVTLTATDVDGDPLTYAVVTGPANGTLTGTAPDLTYAPNGHYNGSDSFTFKASDGTVDSNIATVSITVNAVNDAPVFTSDPFSTSNATQNAAYSDTIAGSATDVDGDTLTYALVSPVTWLSVASDGTLSGTPTSSDVGTNSFTVSVSDGTATAVEATLNITVINTNDAPVANDDSATVDEDGSVAITLTATDLDGDPLTYTVVTAPSNGTLSGTAPDLTYTPNADYNGTDSFTFKANDGTVDSNIATVSITISAINDAPVVLAGDAQTVTLSEGPVATGWSFAPWTGDADADISSAYTYTVAHNFGNNHGGPVTVNGVAFEEAFASSGTGWTIAGTQSNWNGDDDALITDGSEDLAEEFVYNGDPRTVTLSGLTVGETYQVDFYSVAWEDDDRIQTFSATGGEFMDINQSVYGNNNGIRITCVYTATATTQEFTITPASGSTFHLYAMTNRVTPDTVITAVATLDGTVTDADVGDIVTTTWSTFSGPATAVFGDEAAVDTTASFDTAGTYVLRLTADDGTVQPFDDVTITVEEDTSNTAPVASDDSVTTDEDSAVGITLVATDADPGDTLAYSVVSGPSNGTLSGTAPDLTYTPNGDYNGSDSFTFVANDGTVDSNIATVSITVTAVNDAPVANDDLATTAEDTDVAITLTGSDADVGDTLSYSVVTGPANGSLSGTAPNLTYTPNPDYNGSDSFTFVANDGTVDSNIATVSLTINPINNAPSVDAGTNQTVSLDGASGPWTPTDITTTAWYDASDASTIIESAGLVSQWNDKSGNANHMKQASASSQPVTGARSINGLNVMDFDGADALQEDSNAFGATIDDAFVFMVVQRDRAQEEREDFFELNPDWYLQTWVWDNPDAMFRFYSNGTAVSLRNYVPNTSGVTTLLGAYDSTTEDIKQLWVNGVNEAEGVSAGVTTTTSGVMIGAGGTTDDFDGAVAEFITIGSTVSAETRQKIEGYLAHKWGFAASLPAGHPYKDAAPQGNLATTVALDGTVSDPDVGDTVTTTWSVSSSPASVSFDDASAVDTNASFDTLGDYVLRLTADDGTDQSFDEVTITVAGPNTAPTWTANPVDEVDATEDAAYSSTLADDASDADSDSLTYAKVSGPAWLTVATNGDLSGTPSNSDVGANSFTVSVSDGAAPAVEATLNITVINTNDAPVFAADPFNAVDATEDTLYNASIAGSASDADSDPLTYAKVSGPAWLTVATNGDLSGTPSNDDVGSVPFTISVTDSIIATPIEATLNITVNNTNDAPIANDDSAASDEDNAVAITLTASDVDVGDTLSYSVVTGPANGSLSGTAPNLTYTPVANFNGSDSFTFVANDGTVDSNTATVSITVNAVNDAPVAHDQSGTTNEDTAVAVTLTASDVEGDALTYMVTGAPTNGTLSGTAPDLTYTPNANYNGSDSFTFVANDGTVDSNTATVSITVNAVNDTPVFTSDPFSAGDATEDAAYSDTIAGSATDADGDTLTYALVSPATWLSVASDGTLNGTPTNDDVGANSFTVSVSDGTAPAVEATLNITVINTNDASVANDDSATVDEDSSVVVTLTATDVDVGDTLTYTVVTGPTNGSLSGTAPDLTYTPNADYNGTDSFTFTANDGTVDSNTATVSITVNAVNDTPVADDQSVSTDEDIAAAVTLTASDVDIGDTLTYSVVAAPSNGILSGTAPSLTYTPNSNYNGTDSFTFKANDGTVDSNTATVSITINPINDAPVFASDPFSTGEATEDAAYSDTIAGSASDVEGETITYAKVDGPAWLAVASDGTLSGTPGSADVGSNSFMVSASDGTNTTPANLNIEVFGLVVEDYAYAETLIDGTVSGTITDTFSSDNNYETITEEESNGKPTDRYSFLEHKWEFDVAGGTTVSFNVEAHHSANGEGDNFTFAYSSTGVDGVYTDMLTVTKTADDNTAQSFTLPGGTSGIIHVRVLDTDTTAGNRTLDTLSVDQMYILSE
ncbi:hypothetical protein DDZ13_07760 [Coraliomargarita sinensis]|uniref:Dystroglycan-type cadherin-like domain-containing protein n=1 Tax=Coraliomargarita sinensis TaxID=2174842 RepID=A0A317ZKE2_9BACT|nr:Ig-like domain-containing protein [Coraliomargarita sinensis]PXA04418.1 hypothetical protein DDZ13_07760 [Coraliomargarita sinensis]